MASNSKKVELSGVIYVKDPRDIQTIMKLKKELSDLRKEKRQSDRIVRKYYQDKQMEGRLDQKKKEVNKALTCLHDQHQKLNKLVDRKLKSFLWMDYWKKQVLDSALKFKNEVV